MPKVADLSAHEAATIAREIWHNMGEKKASQQLLYYALTQDKNCPQALLGLTNALTAIAGAEITVVISDYTYHAVTDEKIKSRITFIRRMSLDSLGVLSHSFGDMSDLPLNEWAQKWEHSPDFVEDQEALARITKDVLKTHTLKEAFEAACLLVGLRAGLIVPRRETKSPPDFQDCFYPDNFRQADHYSSFLAAEKLEAELEN